MFLGSDPSSASRLVKVLQSWSGTGCVGSEALLDRDLASPLPSSKVTSNSWSILLGFRRPLQGGWGEEDGVPPGRV